MIKEIKKIQINNVDYLNLLDNHLSIQLSLDGFSFCVYNKIQKKIGVFEVYEFTEQNISPKKHLELVKEIYVNHKILSLKYNSVSVTHFNNLVSQVPEPFFDKNNLPNYLQYSVKLLEDDFIAYDTIQNTEIVNVYVPFVNINNFMIDVYGTFFYKHSSTILIEKLLQQFKNTDKEICFINVTKNQFEIVIINNNKLLLYNCFDFTTKEDFIYYILFTAEQLKLNPEEVQTILLGDIEEESELYTILYQYIRNVSFYKPTFFPEALKDVSKHYFFTLLNQF
ncbi:MAG: DUF3822 family protein [Lutibacter sp.]|uniref:DUF3822 family protein n=1 Tax=Lutibacter sp. TaxID=1925666 RepID=UPI00299E3CF7|nr:DUF3822 family protein [Lutibacter sp.]MDX1827920.1 DUF3822 family protein [Lutibacter sp.]